MEQRDTFDAVAEIYAEVRPGYPRALFDDLAALAGLSPDAAVLEVGCGAGQATGDLAARARRVVALDPGPQLIVQARAKVAAANAEFVVSTFEALQAEPEAFDLVASAQAWHWVDPAVGFAKAAQALKLGGALAIFGHVPMPTPAGFVPAFERAFQRHAPGAWGHPPSQAWYLPAGPVAGIIQASGLFGPAIHRAYPWTWRLDPETYKRYLRTESGFNVLPEGARFALFDELAQAIADHGGVMDAPWETHLYVARKSPA
ncbi:class I SAM-dependent methyltransferase [uncultured Phenylobacterium sp.]|uniref:class I SAM-dependent methyltransferase n=1 Tax=uncultured Phenylobacterium sp. TaxID=349273 RepID=UPI0025F06D9D|nr:class I SAM-dependent methyltransferase [uncultured Phenylobacterium sp.]